MSAGSMPGRTQTIEKVAVEQCWGHARHKGGDFPAGRIQRRNVRIQGPEREPRRPGASIEGSTVLPLSACIAAGRSARERPGAKGERIEHRREVDGGHGGRSRSHLVSMVSPGPDRSRWSRRPRRPGACRACRGPRRPVPVKLERPLRPGLARGLAPCRGASSMRRTWVRRAKRIA